MTARDISLETRNLIVRINANLAVDQTDDMIDEIATCYFDILSDDEAHGDTDWEDFFNFCLLDGVVLAAVYREHTLELRAFPGEEAFIELTNNLAMTDVSDFLAIVGKHVGGEPELLALPMSEAEPWMESRCADE